MLVATLCERLEKVATTLATVAVKVPWSVPLPRLRAALTTVLLSLVTRLPKPSSIRTTGCCAKVTPAVALDEGCVLIANLDAVAGLTVTTLEVAPERLPPEKAIVILVATV